MVQQQVTQRLILMLVTCTTIRVVASERIREVHGKTCKPSSSDQTNINTLAGISADVTSLANAIGVSTTYVVTVVGGVFYIDGVSAPTLTLRQR